MTAVPSARRETVQQGSLTRVRYGVPRPRVPYRGMVPSRRPNTRRKSAARLMHAGRRRAGTRDRYGAGGPGSASRGLAAAAAYS